MTLQALKQPEAAPATALKTIPTTPVGDAFLSADDLVVAKRQAAETRLRVLLAEMEELIRANRWQDVVALFSPVEEKAPFLAASGLDVPVREKIAFALGHIGRYDAAIDELSLCIDREPEQFRLHNSLAYTAYNSLFAAANREILLTGKMRQDRIALAHRHFQAAQRLRPDGVTNCYREGMLYRRIEAKPEKALPLFEKAIRHWDALSPDDRERRHQERKNAVKSRYQAASLRLERGAVKEAATLLKQCMAEDETSDYVERRFKYFALGKVEYHLGRFKAARDALTAAESYCAGKPSDFIHELLARVYLTLDEPERAMATVKKTPERLRRPYYRWTEADVWCAQGNYDRARGVLRAAAERDGRSRHKSLVRLARIDYLLKDHQEGITHAAAADRFFREKWGNPCADGLYWQALHTYRAGDLPKARQLAATLEDHAPGYPQLGRLKAAIEKDAAP